MKVIDCLRRAWWKLYDADGEATEVLWIMHGNSHPCFGCKIESVHGTEARDAYWLQNLDGSLVPRQRVSLAEEARLSIDAVLH